MFLRVSFSFSAGCLPIFVSVGNTATRWNLLPVRFVLRVLLVIEIEGKSSVSRNSHRFCLWWLSVVKAITSKNKGSMVDQIFSFSEYFRRQAKKLACLSIESKNKRNSLCLNEDAILIFLQLSTFSHLLIGFPCCRTINTNILISPIYTINSCPSPTNGRTLQRPYRTLRRPSPHYPKTTLRKPQPQHTLSAPHIVYDDYLQQNRRNRSGGL